jgi:hypothetical protein
MKRLLKLTVALVLVGALLIPAGMALAVPPPLDVDVDIKPASCPNPFNVGSKGVVSVAILGSGDFDVTHVDPATVELDGAAPVRWALEDVATPFEGGLCDCHELGADGYSDLTLKFAIQEVVDMLVDPVDEEVVQLTLTGNLKAEFGGAPIEGSDCVVIKARNVE